MKSIDIVFENNHLLVVNKSAGMVVNRAGTVQEETLQDLIVDYLNLGEEDLGVGDRAGIVHRLDKETSGILLIAKDEKTFLALQKQFKDREVEKEYTALVHGELGEEGIVDENIGRVGKFGKFGISSEGRTAKTGYKKIKSLSFPVEKMSEFVGDVGLTKARIRYLTQNARVYSLLSVYPKTGRTHQIRVHLKYLGHPVVSDLIYAPAKLLKFDLIWCPRLFLHAKRISFTDPASGKRVEFSVDMPNDLKNAMQFMRSI